MPSSACQKCALRSEEHTSELQSHSHLVCRLLLEKNIRRLADHALARLAVALEARLRVRDVPHRGVFIFVFFFNDPAPTEIYPLSLPDALPINDTATTEIYSLSLHDALPISVVAVS